MKKLGFLMPLLAMALMLASTATTYAQVIAYDNGVQPGNQNYPASLGNDFTVNSPILVTSLGAFASGGAAGFTGTITVGIYSTTSMLLVTPTISFSGSSASSAGTYINGDWFKPLSPAVVLPPGNYSIVAVGFTADLDGNSTGGGYTPATQNTGGGLITFSPNGRYDANTADTTLTFPTDTIGNPFQFLAGTFQFKKVKAYSVTYYSNANTANAPDATLRIINDGSTAGNLFADIYVFDDSEELQECCGCVITPDGLLSESVNKNLTANPLTGIKPTRGVIKVITDSGVTSSVSESPANAGLIPLSTGLSGWATHVQKLASGFAVSEGELGDGNLATSEEVMLQELCYFDAQLSGKSCTCTLEDNDF